MAQVLLLKREQAASMKPLFSESWDMMVGPRNSSRTSCLVALGFLLEVVQARAPGGELDRVRKELGSERVLASTPPPQQTFNDGGNPPRPVQPSTRFTENDHELDVIIGDDDKYMYCAHGRELCNLCCKDFRINNLMVNGGESSDDVWYSYVWDWHEKRCEAERNLMIRLHASQRRSPERFLDPGSIESHELLLQVEEQFHDILPAWPPPPLRQHVSGSAPEPEVQPQDAAAAADYLWRRRQHRFHFVDREEYTGLSHAPEPQPEP